MAQSISPQFQETLAQLFQKLSQSLADYDYAEQQKRREYEANLHNAGLDRTAAIRNNQVSMADRGLTQSGIALQGNVDLNSAYDTKNAGYAGALSAELSSLARKRLTVEAEYNLQKAQLERQSAAASAIKSGYAGGGSSGGSGGYSTPLAPVNNASGGLMPAYQTAQMPRVTPTGNGYGASQHPIANKKAKIGAAGGGIVRSM